MPITASKPTEWKMFTFKEDQRSKAAGFIQGHLRDPEDESRTLDAIEASTGHLLTGWAMDLNAKPQKNVTRSSRWLSGQRSTNRRHDAAAS